MRKYAFITVIVTMFALTAGAMVFMFGRQDEHWTTRSKEALEEFRLGLQDEHRFYRADALGHYARALELDPEFVMARLKVAQLGDPIPREKWLEMLNPIALEDLSEREKALIGIRIARVHQDRDAAAKIIDDYLQRNPSDPHILSVKCEASWTAQDWQKARECYERVIRVDPNWMAAVNNLGYIAMAQGRMDEAYDQFATYRYIAPDQANPYDSMGELLTLLGRYDEAREQFLRAVELRPDYCASWEHLLLADAIRGDFEQYVRDHEQARRDSGCERTASIGSCGREIVDSIRDNRSVAEIFERPECSRNISGEMLTMAYHHALRSGDSEAMKGMEQRLRGDGKRPSAMLNHFEGLRLLRERRPAQAARTLEEIDKGLVWFGDGQGVFKVVNRAALVSALERAGERERATRIAEETRRINADLFERTLAEARRL